MQDDPARPPWMPPADDPEGPAPWDQEQADWLIGKYVLAGITWLAADGQTVTGQGQYYGRIVAVAKEAGVKIECEGEWVGQTMTLPPDLRVFHLADPGEYRLRSTGEVVKEPDVLTTWTLTAAEPMKS